MRKYCAMSRSETVGETARIPANTLGESVSSSCFFHWLRQFPRFFISSIDRVGSAGIMEIIAGATVACSRAREIRSIFVSGLTEKGAFLPVEKKGFFRTARNR